MGSSQIQHGTSSKISSILYKNPEKYKKLLEPYERALIKKYPDPYLKTFFGSIGNKIISIGPMYLCESLAKDLSASVTEKDLAALGLHMLAISTHDDVVDETPVDRIALGALVYAGNIATNEGSKILIRQNKQKAADVLLEMINLNHLYQQRVLESLWQKKPDSFKEYKKGIEHICIYTAIGLVYGLALIDKLNYKKRIMEFSYGYGIACQLIDDLREQEEDRKNGYWSYPLVEGPPFSNSFAQLFKHLDQALEAIPTDWQNLRTIVSNMRQFALNLKTSYE